MKNENKDTEACNFTVLKHRPTDYRAMMEYLDILCQKYPFVSVSFIGTSILGKSIPIIHIGNENAPAVLYVGAHHGMEWITSSLLLNFADDFCRLSESGISVFGIYPRALSKARQIKIVPMLNPDGVELQINGIRGNNPLRERLLTMNPKNDFSSWQANARGVDLNHNYDAGFEEYKILEREAGILSGCATRYSGEFPESEPETGALCNLIRWDDGIRGALTLHSQGEEIYCSAEGEMYNRCKAIGKLLEKMTGYKLCTPETMASYGGMTDWMVSKMKLPSFTVECGKGKNPLPISDFFPIYTKIREMLFTFPILV